MTKLCIVARFRIGILAALMLELTSVAAEAEPFATRDQNPLLAGIGLPMPFAARFAPAGAWSTSAAFNWSSTALVQANGSQRLIVDAETRELRLTLERTASERLAWRLQLPYRYTGGGALDGFIDGWHDFFGLDEGARPVLPRDQIRIEYARDGVTLLDRRTSAGGFADLSLAVGYALFATPASAASAWLEIKLPTGDADDFTGSGAADATFALAGDHRFGGRWSVFAQAGVTWPGDADLLRGARRDFAWSALAGVGWQAAAQLELKAQIDAHSAVLEPAELDFFSSAAILTVGGTYSFASAWQLELGVSEDIAVEASPDVVFVLGLRYRRGQ